MNKEREKNQPADPTQETTESIDKVRDILFGNNIRDFEKRFSRLEERLQKDIQESRDEVNRAFKTLEAFTKEEIQILTGLVKQESDQRQEAIRKLQQSIEELRDRLSRLDDQQQKNQAEIRQQLLAQRRDLSEETQRVNSELKEQIRTESATLSMNKTDRKALAGMFTEMAIFLSQEPETPRND
ncbi:MAG: hypothetical protein KBA26_09215 [Candidatus Delongbacteria bacterium]|nr:hypothetical protein [Candidatus Delongbacteria bacterium]